MEMTDREMLALAAKAVNKAGGHIQIVPNPHCFEAYDHARADGYTSPDWNPIESDGDALRLSVSLGLIINMGFGRHNVSVNYDPAHVFYIEHGEDEDKTEIVRKAIVRAAAEIGKSCPSE